MVTVYVSSLCSMVRWRLGQQMTTALQLFSGDWECCTRSSVSSTYLSQAPSGHCGSAAVLLGRNWPSVAGEQISTELWASRTAWNSQRRRKMKNLQHFEK